MTGFLIALLFSFNIYAVMTQHDVDRSHYRAFAKEPQFDNVGWIRIITPEGVRECTGTLIDPRTVLTSAHCMGHFSHSQITTPSASYQSWGSFTLTDNKDAPVPFNREHFNFLNARIFPACFSEVVERDGISYQVNLSCDDDIAFLYLDHPMFRRDFLPVNISSSADFYLNTKIHVAGFGRTGTGISLQPEYSMEKLAASMIIDKIFRRQQTDKWILSAKFLWGQRWELLGATGNGDSGGPVIAYSPQGMPSIIGVVRSTDFFSGNLYDEGWGKVMYLLYNQNQISRDQFFEQYFNPGSEYQHFVGYGSRRYFVPTASYGNFISSGMATKWVLSDHTATVYNPHYWSNNFAWRHKSPPFSSGTGRSNVRINSFSLADNAGALNHFFNANITAPVIADIDVTIDELLLSNPRSAVTVPKDRLLTSFFTRVDEGNLLVEGTLLTSSLTINRGALSGTGNISLVHGNDWSTPQSRLFSTGMLINHGGLVGLSCLSPSSSSSQCKTPLTIEGGYHHGRQAKLHVRINSDGTAPSLHATSDIILEGGYLAVQLAESRHWPSNPHTSTMYEWPIISSDTKIVGTFDHVSLQDSAQSDKTQFHVMYTSNSVVVVIEKSPQ